MLEGLKIKVCEANLELMQKGLVIYTWGNVSGVDRKTGIMAIKPSGVDYSGMKPDDMVLVDVATGKTVEGRYKPSSDMMTHLELYRSYPSIGGIAHTHSINAVAFAQAGIDIPPLGTTHADYFYGPIPCTRELTKEEVEDDYEWNTGKVIVECLKNHNLNPAEVPGVVVKNHGPFCWGGDAASSVYHAVIMDTIAEMGLKTLFLNPQAFMPKYILEKHYKRKHGLNSYYGQDEYSKQ